MCTTGAKRYLPPADRCLKQQLVYNSKRLEQSFVRTSRSDCGWSCHFAESKRFLWERINSESGRFAFSSMVNHSCPFTETTLGTPTTAVSCSTTGLQLIPPDFIPVVQQYLDRRNTAFLPLNIASLHSSLHFTWILNASCACC